MDNITVLVETEVNPTESQEKVKETIEKIFGITQTTTQLIHKGGIITAQSNSLDSLTKLRNMLRRDRIRAAARIALLGGLDHHSLTFFMNKQVAYAGHVSFAKEAGESPLGPIKVKVVCEDPKAVVDWLTS